MDLARFSDFELTNFNAAITTKAYTFEVWIYSQTYVAGKFGTYNFIWNRYLKVEIKGKNTSYASTCYPLWEAAYADKSVNKQEVEFTSDQLPWVYLRCSVNITTKKYFHFHEKSSITEQTLTTSLTDVLTGAASLKFENNTKNKGILFFRLLRLYNCYDCQTADNYRINWVNVEIIKSQIANFNLLYHVDGKILANETIDRSDPDAEQKQKLKYIKGSSGVEESAVLVPLPKSEFIGYGALDITTANKYGQLYTPQASNYLCPENTYFCLGLVKLNQVSNVQIDTVTPSFTGKYTIEFWTMITSVSNIANGFHIIWKNLGSVTIIKDNSNNSSLNMICWPQDHMFSALNIIEGKSGTDIHNLYSGAAIANKDKQIRTINIDNKWLYVRCAVNTSIKKFYSVLEDETTVGTPTEVTMTATTPMAYAFTAGDTTSVLLNGMSGNSSCVIYLRNLWLYANYLLPNYNTRHL